MLKPRPTTGQPAKAWLVALLASAQFGLCAPHIGAQDVSPQPASTVGSAIAPRPLWVSPPQYPADANGQPALVTATLLVDVSGSPQNITVLTIEHPDPSDHWKFEIAALDYLRATKFEPGQVGGKAVEGQVRVQVAFESPASVTKEAQAPQRRQQESSNNESTEYGATAEIDIALSPDVPAAASSYRIPLRMLRYVPRRATEQYLTLTPGVVLVNHSGEGHASQAFMRGFDAGEGQDLEVRVDGVPVNEPSNAHGHGYADTHFVIPETVATIEVLQGPFDPRQGSFAVSGTAEYHLGVPQSGISAQVELGSFGHRRVLALWAPSPTVPERFAAFELQQGDGFGPSRAHERVTAAGQYAGRSGGLRYRVGATAHALRFDSAGVIRADALETGDGLKCPTSKDELFFCTHDPNQDGSARRVQLSGAIEGGGGGFVTEHSAFIALRGNRFRENFTGYLIDDRGDLLDEQSQYVTAGLRGHIRTERTLWGNTQRLELGYDGRYDQGNVRQWRIRRDASIPYDTVFDNDLGLMNIAGYARLQLALARLRILFGLRADAFGFEVTDRDRPTEDLSGERLPQQSTTAFGSIVQPRISLRYRLIEDLHAQLAAGLGARASDATALSQGEKAPFARVTATEAGFIFDRRTQQATLDSRLIGFFTHVDRDLLFDPNAGRNVPIGASNRFGVTASARFALRNHLDTMHSLSWSEAYLPTDGESIGFREGNRMPFVPRFSGRSDTMYHDQIQLLGQRFEWSLALGATWVGPRPLPQETLSEPILSIDMRAGLEWNHWSLALAVENLFDRRNRMAEFNYPSRFDPTAPASMRYVRHFSAGPPRSLMLTLAAHFDVSDVSDEERTSHD